MRQLDVRSPHEVADAIASIQREVGGIHVWVNCHGVMQLFGDVSDTSDDEMRRVMSVNFEGTFVCCRAIAREMRVQRYGRIVNVASQAGKAPWPKIAVYGSSKAAVISLTQGLAMELGPFGVTANAVCPGVMDTEMTRRAYAGPAREQLLADKAGSLPVRRLGTPQDLGALVLWLASPDAGFMTGATLNLTGGEQFF